GGGDALVEEAHDLVPVVAMGAAFLPHAFAVVQEVEHEQRQHGGDGDGHVPLDPVKETEHAKHGDRVGDKVDEEAVGQVVNLAGVLGDAGDGAAGLIGVEVAQREALQVGEEPDAQVADELHGG